MGTRLLYFTSMFGSKFKTFARFGVAALSAQLILAPLTANEPDAPTSIDDYAQITALVSYFLQNQHFSRHQIDEEVAREWIENYMMDLDPNRMVFLKSDYDEFTDTFSGPITKAINNEIEVPAFTFFGNRAPIQASKKFGPMAVEPAYTVYNRFKERVKNRVTWAHQRLKEPFKFDAEEYYSIDRSQAEWPASAREADQLWEKRLKSEILRDQLSDLDEEELVSSNPTVTPENFEVAEATLEKIHKRYDRILKYSEQTDQQDILEIYLSALTSTFDPHSQYLSQKTLEDFHIMMQQKLVGIGAVLNIDPRTGYCTIREIMPGGPADMDGRIKVNDKIAGVAQGKDGEFVDVYDMKLRDTVRLIRGNLGTVVRLEVIPADADDSASRKVIELVRNEISVSMQKAKARRVTLDAEKGQDPVHLGIIELPSFYGDKEEGNSTTTDVRDLIVELKKEGIDGLVLDLRNNGGGLLNEAIHLTGLFIEQGPVVQVKNFNDAGSTYKDRDEQVAYDGPLIVLTNKLSASASEIVAGALQNYRRAVIVGDQSTHGKGTVQTVAALNDFLKLPDQKGEIAGAMKLTVQQFYLPDGTSTQERGIIPDISLPSLNDYIEIGESTLPHALPWNQIDAVDFSPLNDLSPQVIDVLAHRSQFRISKNKDFELLNQDIQKLQDRMKDKRESLNLTQRLNEMAEHERLKELKDACLDRIYLNLPSITSLTFNEERTIDRTVEEAIDPEQIDEKSDERLPYPAVYANDLHLQETLNILQDWILIQQKKLPQETIALNEAGPSES
jgi:carboxyl-terminal processing protease